MSDVPNQTPGKGGFRAGAHPSDGSFEDRKRQLEAQEGQLAEARAAFRHERDSERQRLAADRAEVDRLQREARAHHQEAARRHDRTKRLAYRYARRVRQKWADVRAELKAQRAAVDEARGQFSAETARFEIVRSDFHAAAAEEKERLREEWDALESQRRRTAAERAEMNEYLTKQESILEARAAELTDRERAVSEARATLERETASLRAEAAGLEARVQNARLVVEELERKREQLRNDLLGTAVPTETESPDGYRVALDRAADRDLTQWVAELDARDQQLAQEKAGLAAVRAGLDRDAADLADQRQVVAEQFVLLATARAQWQEAERRTVGEMEELARGLRRREQDLDAREERLVRADARRREDSYELWQFRLRLEAWQSKLTTVERRWHAERELRDAEYDRRVRTLTRRETEVEGLFSRWEHSRTSERERLQTELRLWANDRARLAKAAESYDRQSREVLVELVAHAARALASEELVAKSDAGAGSGRAKRRLEVLQKRWEQVFRRKLDEVDSRRTAASAELARLEERYQAVHRSLMDVLEREGRLNTRSAQADATILSHADALNQDIPFAQPVDNPPPETSELVVLRDEFERMAAVLLDAKLPEPPDSELPWGAEEPEPEPASVLQFPQQNRAA